MRLENVIVVAWADLEELATCHRHVKNTSPWGLLSLKSSVTAGL